MKRSREHGFTYLEVLFALAVLTILAAGLMSSSSGILQAGARARSMEESCFVANELATEIWLERPYSELVSVFAEDWRVEVTPIEGENGGGALRWNRLTVTPSNFPSQRAAFFFLGTLEAAPGVGIAKGLRQLIKSQSEQQPKTE